MSSGHPTREVDADIVRLLASIQTTVDDMRRDICGHLHDLENKYVDLETKALNQTSVLRRFESNIELLAGEISTLRSSVRRHDSALRDTSESDLKHESDMAAAIVHVNKLEESITDTRDAVGAIVDELGIAGRVKLGASVPPGGKPKATALTKIARENKGSVAASLVAAGMVTLQIVLEWLRHH